MNIRIQRGGTLQNILHNTLIQIVLTSLSSQHPITINTVVHTVSHLKGVVKPTRQNEFETLRGKQSALIRTPLQASTPSVVPPSPFCKAYMLHTPVCIYQCQTSHCALGSSISNWIMVRDFVSGGKQTSVNHTWRALTSVRLSMGARPLFSASARGTTSKASENARIAYCSMPGYLHTNAHAPPLTSSNLLGTIVLVPSNSYLVWMVRRMKPLLLQRASGRSRV